MRATPFYASLALLAFAANSLLCRLALKDGAIDPATFATVRLSSGALLLVWLVGPRWPSRLWPNVASALALFAYAVPFSYAYRSLTTGTGALLLFGAVQVTMLLVSVLGGERPRWTQAAGTAVAFAGLTYLVWPGVAAPPVWDATLMLGAGVAWGVYSLRGRTAGDPSAATALNFALAVPMALGLTAATLGDAHAEPRGLVAAVFSGAVASGLGYVAWYRALKGMSAITASTLQLLVPLLAAVAGVILLGETVSIRLAVAAVLILGGVGAAIRR